MSNLLEHAKRELALIEEDPDMVTGILEMIDIFSRMGHSGSSAAYCIYELTELLNFKNLSPLTNDLSEWMEVGPGMWQNTRNSEAFSLDEGKTYYLLSEGANSNNPNPLHTTIDKGTNNA